MMVGRRALWLLLGLSIAACTAELGKLDGGEMAHEKKAGVAQALPLPAGPNDVWPPSEASGLPCDIADGMRGPASLRGILRSPIR